eukprot:IDg16514t1
MQGLGKIWARFGTPPSHTGLKRLGGPLGSQYPSLAQHSSLFGIFLLHGEQAGSYAPPVV